MHPRMRAPEYASRVTDFADKYSLPIREFPDDGTRALNVYRADVFPAACRSDSRLSPRRERPSRARRRADPRRPRRRRRSRRAARASARVAELRLTDEFTTMAETGHLCRWTSGREETAKLLVLVAHFRWTPLKSVGHVEAVEELGGVSKHVAGAVFRDQSEHRRCQHPSETPVSKGRGPPCDLDAVS